MSVWGSANLLDLCYDSVELFKNLVLTKIL